LAILSKSTALWRLQTAGKPYLANGDYAKN